MQNILMVLAVASVAACMTGCAAQAAKGQSMKINQSPFGTTPDGQKVELYTLANSRGAVAKITNYGATLTELHMPDRNGNLADVVLGFDTLEGYLGEDNPFFGTNAGRVANRIAKGRFVLDGRHYTLATNNETNHLHGGVKGFDKVVWTAEPQATSKGPGLKLTYRSRDGEEGYPGNLETTIVYTLTNDNELLVEMSAVTDAPTIVNIAHHTYWNLGGHKSGDVLGHTLKLHADRYTPADDTLIPTGEIAAVKGSPFDFTAPKPLGKDIAAFKVESQKQTGGGYDVNFVLNDASPKLHPCAVLTDPKSGRTMEILTTDPGVQLYTGNWMEGIKGKAGAVYNQHHGVCLETQKFPDAINHPNFPSIVLRPGQVYKHAMVHRFTAQ